jgi:hypothetical protein
MVSNGKSEDEIEEYDLEDAGLGTPHGEACHPTPFVIQLAPRASLSPYYADMAN